MHRALWLRAWSADALKERGQRRGWRGALSSAWRAQWVVGWATTRGPMQGCWGGGVCTRTLLAYVRLCVHGACGHCRGRAGVPVWLYGRMQPRDCAWDVWGRAAGALPVSGWVRPQCGCGHGIFGLDPLVAV